MPIIGLVEQRIRFCRSRDGVQLAYASSGEGPPLVKVANFLTHLEYEFGECKAIVQCKVTCQGIVCAEAEVVAVRMIEQHLPAAAAVA